MNLKENKMIDFKEKKENARKSLELHADRIRQFRDEEGNKYCDYLVYNLQMEEYYRGVWNTLNELEREQNEKYYRSSY